MRAMAVLARSTTGECGSRCRTMAGSDAACRSMGGVVGDEELGAEDLETEDADLWLRRSAERRSALTSLPATRIGSGSRNRNRLQKGTAFDASSAMQLLPLPCAQMFDWYPQRAPSTVDSEKKLAHSS